MAARRNIRNARPVGQEPSILDVLTEFVRGGSEVVARGEIGKLLAVSVEDGTGQHVDGPPTCIPRRPEGTPRGCGEASRAKCWAK